MNSKKLILIRIGDSILCVQNPVKIGYLYFRSNKIPSRGRHHFFLGSIAGKPPSPYAPGRHRSDPAYVKITHLQPLQVHRTALLLSTFPDKTFYRYLRF